MNDSCVYGASVIHQESIISSPPDLFDHILGHYASKFVCHIFRSTFAASKVVSQIFNFAAQLKKRENTHTRSAGLIILFVHVEALSLFSFMFGVFVFIFAACFFRDGETLFRLFTLRFGFHDVLT